MVEMTIDDAWAQDKGPFYVVNDKGDMRGVTWGWNAYGGLEGGLYFPWKRDQEFATKLLDLENYDAYDATKMVFEGGAMQIDGEGTLIVTENSVLNHNRNPHLTKEEAEWYFKEYMGLEKVIWLKDGMAFDETDGHIDDVCFFVRPGVLALSWTDDEDNPQYPNLKAAYDVLSEATDAKGRTFRDPQDPDPRHHPYLRGGERRRGSLQGRRVPRGRPAVGHHVHQQLLRERRPAGSPVRRSDGPGGVRYVRRAHARPRDHQDLHPRVVAVRRQHPLLALQQPDPAAIAAKLG